MGINVFQICMFIVTIITGIVAVLVYSYERRHDYCNILFRKSKVLFTIFLILLGISIVVTLVYAKMGEFGLL